MLKNFWTYLILAWIIISHADAITQPYDEAVSLGYGCQVAWQLEANGVRKCAYPFDWFQTPFDSLLAFISNKGANFLDVDKIVVMGPYPGDPSRLHVIDAVYGIASYHDFIISPPLGNYTEVKAKYDRRIKRFFDLLHSNKRILFVRQGLSRAEVEYLDHVLHTLYPKLSYTILVVNDSDEYRYCWGLKRIQNFYLPQALGDWMGDFARWKEILSQFPIIPAPQPRQPQDIW